MKKIICFFISLICLSCAIIDFSSSDSIKVNPSKFNQVLGENEDVYVKYGFSPDHVSAQSAFEIHDAEGRVAGSFKWKDNTMIFAPLEHFSIHNFSEAHNNHSQYPPSL